MSHITLAAFFICFIFSHGNKMVIVSHWVVDYDIAVLLVKIVTVTVDPEKRTAVDRREEEVMEFWTSYFKTIA